MHKNSLYFLFMLLAPSYVLADTNTCYETVKTDILAALKNGKVEILQNEPARQKEIIMTIFGMSFAEAVKKCSYFDLVQLSQEEERRVSFILEKEDGTQIKYPSIKISKNRWIENKTIQYGILITKDDIPIGEEIPRKNNINIDYPKQCSEIDKIVGAIIDSADINVVGQEVLKAKNKEYYISQSKSSFYRFPGMLIYNPDGWEGRGEDADRIYTFDNFDYANQVISKFKDKLSATAKKGCYAQNIYTVMIDQYTKCETIKTGGDAPFSGRKVPVGCVSKIKVLKKIGTVL